MPKYKMSNGIKVELTAEEEAEIITEQTRMTTHSMKKIEMYQTGVKKRSLAVQNSLNQMHKKVKQLTR